MTMRNVVAVTILALALVGCGDKSASPPEKPKLNQKELYELQEHCAKSSAQLFKEDWQTSDNKDDILDYETHYNTKLNKCFQLVSQTGYDKEKGHNFLRVSDVLAHKEAASYYETFDLKTMKNTDTALCTVAGEKLGCQSEDAFKALIKPMMTE